VVKHGHVEPLAGDFAGDLAEHAPARRRGARNEVVEGAHVERGAFVEADMDAGPELVLEGTQRIAEPAQVQPADRRVRLGARPLGAFLRRARGSGFKARGSVGKISVAARWKRKKLKKYI
jgi:hypothetical protein